MTVIRKRGDALAGNLHRIEHGNAVVSEQVECMGPDVVVKAMENNGFAGFFNKFSHPVGGVFFDAPEKADNE
ncbi:hypothetical protein ACFLRW_01350 [Acidobacteriota bacterium]